MTLHARWRTFALRTALWRRMCVSTPFDECQDSGKREQPVPTYQYACTACEHRFEAVQSFSDASLTECPECAGKLRKLYGSVGVVFKGSGFYRTDSRSEAKSPALRVLLVGWQVVRLSRRTSSSSSATRLRRRRLRRVLLLVLLVEGLQFVLGVIVLRRYDEHGQDRLLTRVVHSPLSCPQPPVSPANRRRPAVASVSCPLATPSAPRPSPPVPRRPRLAPHARAAPRRGRRARAAGRGAGGPRHRRRHAASRRCRCWSPPATCAPGASLRAGRRAGRARAGVVTPARPR